MLKGILWLVLAMYKHALKTCSTLQQIMHWELENYLAIYVASIKFIRECGSPPGVNDQGCHEIVATKFHDFSMTI